jgi:RNA polymerase sigma factor (TIGR02999 family)
VVDGEPGPVTALLERMRGGDAAARDAIVPLVYGELRRLAASYLKRERPNHTLQPTALVHEAYMKLVGQQAVVWQNRAHFMGVAAIVMRRLLVNHARDRAAAKRGDGVVPESLTVVGDVAGQSPVDLLALDTALDKLAQLDERKCRVVELKFFTGLTTEETAEAIGASVATVERDWSFARAWLFDQLSR